MSPGSFWLDSLVRSPCILGFACVQSDAIGVVVLIRDSLGRSLVSSVSFVFASVCYLAPRVRWVHSGSRRFQRALQRVVGLIWFRVGSLARAYVSFGSFGFAWVHSDADIGRSFHSSSRGFTRAHLRFFVFFLVRVGSLWRA